MGLAKKRDVPSRPVDPDSRGDRTRRELKRAISRLATRKDVADITLADICAATGLTTGAVYFHFGGKDEAIEEMVIDELAMVYGDRMRTGGDTFDAYVTNIVAEVTRYHRKGKRLPIALAAVINARPKAYAAWLEVRQPVIARLEALIADARAAKGLPTEPAPYLAHFILNSIENISMDAYQWENPTLAPFASDADGWNARQIALWSWAILALFPETAPPPAGAA